MIVVVSRQPVLYDLLQNNNKMINQVLVICWILLNLLLKVVESTSHDTRIFITQ